MGSRSYGVAIPRWIATALLVFSVNACATMFSGTEDKIKLSANVHDVKVYLDGRLMGTTPIEVTVKREVGPRRLVKLEKEGYESQQFELEHQFNYVSLLNTTSITSWGVDILTGAMTRYSPTQYQVQMLPTQADEKSPPIFVGS